MSRLRAVQALDVPPSNEPFFEGSALVVPRLAEAGAEETRILLGHDGRLYRYAEGVYRADGDAFVRMRTRDLLGDRFRKRHAEEVLAWFRSTLPTIGELPPPGLLNVRNGLLDLRGLTLEPHSPDTLSTAQLPVEWHPEATCPAIETFFAQQLPDDAIELVYETIGYATYPGNPFRKAVLLLGPTGTGKSKMLGLIEALLGKENVSSVPLQLLAESRFAAAELYGKLANLAGDLDARAVGRSDVFKMATGGGDAITAERKFGHPFKFAVHALLMFSANEPPISADQSDAWFDRWLIVPMERQRPESDPVRDPFLLAKLTTADELSGLLVKAVHALRRLMGRGQFDLPESVLKAGSRYRHKLDTAVGFVDEVCALSPENWTPRPVLYRAYREWCKDSGRLPVSAERFNDHLRSAHGDVVEETTRRGTRGWAGIGVTA